MVNVVSGSISETSGTTALLTTENFMRSSWLEMITNCETSAEVPAVVGIRISGGLGTRSRSTPSNSRMLRPWAATMPMPLAQSIGLPPPTATITLQPSLR
ncbi:hypothetical protein PA7078_03975 [Pseudomonas aeruginosa]|nr:Uncharacterised protein [Pseudomonas aeruginosa]